MNACRQFESGVVELYFYDELDLSARAGSPRSIMQARCLRSIVLIYYSQTL